METIGELPFITTMLIDSFQPGIMDSSVTGAALDHLQLGKGRFIGHQLHARFGASRLDWGHYNLPVLARGVMAEDAVTLGLIFTPQEAGIFSGLEVNGTAAVVMTEGTELDYRLAGDTCWAAFQVPRARLESAGVFFPAKMISVMNAGALKERLSDILEQVVSGCYQLAAPTSQTPDATAFGQVLQDILFSEFIRIIDSDETRSGSGGLSCGPTLRAVNRVADYLDTHYGEPVLVETLCTVAGVSWKTLERAFRKSYGLTPKAYLTHLRLSRARGLLLDRRRSGDTVARIANRCGFTHFGRFASSYRALYGERPSETGMTSRIRD